MHCGNIQLNKWTKLPTIIKNTYILEHMPVIQMRWDSLIFDVHAHSLQIRRPAPATNASTRCMLPSGHEMHPNDHAWPKPQKEANGSIALMPVFAGCAATGGTCGKPVAIGMPIPGIAAAP